jgi:CubicO group peptidase (beta-lactamase class C family)
MKLPKLVPIMGLLLSHITPIKSACYDPSPATPPPNFDSPSPELDQAFSIIATLLNETISTQNYSTTSFSLEITSSKHTLFTHYHTATTRSPTRPGAPTVNGTSSYRIASITKAFTVLAILQEHAKGTLHLDDAISDYLPALLKKQSGTLPWKDITLRALGSQLSGIPGDVFQDLINFLPRPEALGLPPKSRQGLNLPTCDGFSETEPKRPCGKEDLIRELMKQRPNFAPAQQPSYCNAGFEILGLVLEEVSGKGYSEYIHGMLGEMGIEGITLERPGDEVAVLPMGEAWYWDVDQGVERPWVCLFYLACFVGWRG